MRKIGVILLLSTLVLASCSKNQKHCWKCYFSGRDTIFTGIDTTVCDMTQEQSQEFQKNMVKAINDKYGTPADPQIGSACHKLNNK